MTEEISPSSDQDRHDELHRLNAFIDGELDVEARAHVISRAAADPVCARQLAALGRLKAALSGAVPVPPMEVPSQTLRGSLRRVALTAAACLALVAAGGFGWLLHGGQPGPAPGRALEWSLEMHRGWTERENAAAPARTIPAFGAARTAVPDLSANGLDLAYAGLRRAPGGDDALVVGYLGSRGCRLTMLVQAVETALPAEPVALETGRMLASIWPAGSLRYALLAEGMDAARFRLLADTVQRATLEHRPLDQGTQTALAKSRAGSPPCRA